MKPFVKPEKARGHGPHVQGYTWHAYPDPATPGVFSDDTPFGTDDTSGPGPTLTHPPEGVVRFWLLRKDTKGIANYTDGHSFLILTEHLEPPEVAAGWSVEEARISPGFELDLGNDRSVVLLRVINTFETTWGPVRHCEFEIDEE